MNKIVKKYEKKANKIFHTLKLIGILLIFLAILISIVQYRINSSKSNQEEQKMSSEDNEYSINLKDNEIVFDKELQIILKIINYSDDNENMIDIKLNGEKIVNNERLEKENSINVSLNEEGKNELNIIIYLNNEEVRNKIINIYYVAPYKGAFLDELVKKGIGVHYPSGENYEKSFPLLKAIGVRYIRTDFKKNVITPDDKTFNFEKYDYWVKDLTENNIKILAILDENYFVDTDIEVNTYTNFYREVKKRYPQIEDFEIMNEVNIQNKGAYLNEEDTRWYSKVLNSIENVKTKSDNIICGGTATGFSGGNWITSETFYSYVYNTNGLVKCNHYAIHPYTINNLEKLRQKIDSHVNLYDSYGGFYKLDITEYGSTTSALSEDKQAVDIVKQTVDLEEKCNFIILYNLWSTGEQIEWSKQFGILRNDYTPKPAYYTYKKYIQNTNGAEYIGSLNITNGLEAHAYDKDGHPLIIAWSNNTDNTYNFTLNQMTAKDIYGKEITPNSNGQIQITTSPVYLYNVPTNYFYQAISNTATTKYNEFTENYADQISKVQGLQQTINTLNQRMKDLSSTSNLDETTSINLMKQHFNLGNTLIQAYKSGTLQIEYVKLSSMLDALNDIGNSFEDLVTVSAKTRNANISETLDTINKADNLINDNDIEMIYPSKILQFSQDFYDKASYINGLEEENDIKTGLIVSKNLHSKLLSDWATQFANLYIDTYIKNNPVTIDYSETNPTNQNVTATLRTNAQITINNNSNSKAYTFTQNGTFTFDYTIKGQTFQQTATVNNIDKTAPTIEGVENDRLYLSEVTPKASDTNLKEVLLYKDNNQVQNYQQNTKITEDGHYKLVAKDSAGNQTTVEFDISRNPAIIDYSEVNLTNQDVVATVNSNFDVNVKNNSNQKSYTFKENGEFTFELNIKGAELQLTAKVDNIDKTPPTITDVEDKKQYIDKVTPKISDDNLNEVKLYFDSEEVQGYTPNSEITGEGFYKLVAKDLAGNETSVEFTIIENPDEKYQIKDGNILNIKNNTNQDTFRKKLKMSGEYSIYRNDTLISDNDKIATGDKLRKSTGEEYTLIVSGDINNDGDVNIKDIVMLRKYLLERNNLDENSLLAADCNLDGKDISIKDLIRMRLIALERDVN